jgi:signal transduction histidine kinase
MSHAPSTPAGSPFWSRAAGWTLDGFTQVPAGSRRVAWLIIVAGVLVIGWADYVAASRMSFVVFYLVPVALSTAWLGRWSGISVALASVAIRITGDTFEQPAALRETWLWWNSIGSLCVFLATVWLLHSLLGLHRQLEQRVRERTAELVREVQKRQQVQRELLELSARERNAMGRELHDQLGQQLVGTAMAAQVLADRLSAQGGPGAPEARHIADLVEDGIAQVRQLAHGLLLAQIEPSRLASELEELCTILRQQYPAVECTFTMGRTEALKDSHAAAQLYRLTQEALRNAFRHAGGTFVSLSGGERDGRLEIIVEDDGRGIALSPHHRGMGLRIMQHRAEHIGANLSIASRPGGGTRVTCSIELKA